MNDFNDSEIVFDNNNICNYCNEFEKRKKTGEKSCNVAIKAFNKRAFSKTHKICLDFGLIFCK